MAHIDDLCLGKCHFRFPFFNPSLNNFLGLVFSNSLPGGLLSNSMGGYFPLPSIVSPTSRLWMEPALPPHVQRAHCSKESSYQLFVFVLHLTTQVYCTARHISAKNGNYIFTVQTTVLSCMRFFYMELRQNRRGVSKDVLSVTFHKRLKTITVWVMWVSAK